MLTFPSVSDLIATSTTGITEILYWTAPVWGVLIALSIGAMLVVLARRRFVGAVAKALGAKGRRRGGRRRR